MKRRKFLTTSSLAGTALTTAVAESAETGSEYYELRLYHMLLGDKKRIFGDFLRDAAIPALNRFGIGPVGVFNVLYGQNNPTQYVLLPHKSLESVVTVTSRLLDDDEYLRAGSKVLNALLSDPAYVRMESTLMAAFDEMPKLVLPSQTAGNKSRIFEMRTYESHNVKAGQKKIEMFNKGGEIEIFRKTGLQPVFFGETLIGLKIPNLTYMLAFESMETRNKNWEVFRSDPEWKKLSANPEYADTVSNITDIILRPETYSQI